ncbi:MAG: histone deacetylase [Planctomycetaceae bacterium]
MTVLYSVDQFLLHETGDHPESPLRLQAVHQRLAGTALLASLQQGECRPATQQELRAAHTVEYLQQLDHFAASGGGRIETDTVVCAASPRIARLAAGTAVNAVQQVMTVSDPTAFCLMRPPGHHALRDGAMGFCLYNNAAIAAQAAKQQYGLERVLIIDWDVHHGNGTQDSFYEDPTVGFLSSHRFPFYPGSGAASETGSGQGLGTTYNLPLRNGSSRRQILDSFTAVLSDAADRIRPQLVILSAGFDAHAEDPVGSLGLETEDFGILTDAVLDVAQTHCGGKVVSLLEGGYNPARLAECVELHLQCLSNRGQNSQGSSAACSN